jgi:hypothetical protein
MALPGCRAAVICRAETGQDTRVYWENIYMEKAKPLDRNHDIDITVYTRLVDADLIQNITVIFVLRLILAISPEGRCKTQPRPCDGRPMSDNTG